MNVCTRRLHQLFRFNFRLTPILLGAYIKQTFQHTAPVHLPSLIYLPGPGIRSELLPQTRQEVSPQHTTLQQKKKTEVSFYQVAVFLKYLSQWKEYQSICIKYQ